MLLASSIAVSKAEHCMAGREKEMERKRGRGMGKRKASRDRIGWRY